MASDPGFTGSPDSPGEACADAPRQFDIPLTDSPHSDYKPTANAFDHSVPTKKDILAARLPKPTPPHISFIPRQVQTYARMSQLGGGDGPRNPLRSGATCDRESNPAPGLPARYERGRHTTIRMTGFFPQDGIPQPAVRPAKRMEGETLNTSQGKIGTRAKHG